MTLVIALSGLVLGLVNLGIRIREMRQSGPAISVELRAGWMVPGGGIANFPIDKFDATEIKQGDTGVVVVTVRNRGRAAIDVSQWYVTIDEVSLGMSTAMEPENVSLLAKSGRLDLTDKFLENMLLQAHNARCPFRLESNSQRHWVVALSAVTDVVASLRQSAELVLLGAEVTLGNGSIVRLKGKAYSNLLAV